MVGLQRAVPGDVVKYDLITAYDVMITHLNVAYKPHNTGAGIATYLHGILL